MDKKLQDLAWSVLPKEFKEEVKNLYKAALDASNSPHDPDDRKWGNCRSGLLEKLFGHHNLTSDAEGEEMLTVSRKKVQELYKNANEGQYDQTISSETRTWCNGQEQLLVSLFGSKCLPDEEDVNVPEPDCKHFSDGKCAHPSVWHLENGELVKGAECDVSSCEDVEYEPKPAEPKFKIGDKVKHSAHPHDDGIYRVDDIKKSSDGFIYHIQGLIGISNVKESDIEPYTEPEKESRNLSKNIVNCDKQLDNILKDSFRNERRLNIATTIMAGMMANPNIIKSRSDLKAISDEWLASRTLELADALIVECEKGGFK